MVRIQLYLTELQEKKLLEIKEITGASKSETIRRAIDQYLKTNEQREGEKNNDNY